MYSLLQYIDATLRSLCSPPPLIVCGVPSLPMKWPDRPQKSSRRCELDSNRTIVLSFNNINRRRLNFFGMMLDLFCVIWRKLDVHNSIERAEYKLGWWWYEYVKEKMVMLEEDTILIQQPTNNIVINNTSHYSKRIVRIVYSGEYESLITPALWLALCLHGSECNQHITLFTA